MRLVMIDNYDSFTYNLVQLFYKFDLEVLVFRHDQVSIGDLEALKPRLAMHLAGPQGPGPGRHQQRGDRPFPPGHPHPGGVPRAPGLKRGLGGGHGQGPRAGARQVLPGAPCGEGAVSGAPHAVYRGALPFSHGRACFSRPRDHGLDRRRRHHGTEPPALSPPRGAVPPGILSHRLRL